MNPLKNTSVKMLPELEIVSIVLPEKPHTTKGLSLPMETGIKYISSSPIKPETATREGKLSPANLGSQDTNPTFPCSMFYYTNIFYWGTEKYHISNHPIVIELL